MPIFFFSSAQVHQMGFAFRGILVLLSSCCFCRDAVQAPNPLGAPYTKFECLQTKKERCHKAVAREHVCPVGVASLAPVESTGCMSFLLHLLVFCSNYYPMPNSDDGDTPSLPLPKAYKMAVLFVAVGFFYTVLFLADVIAVTAAKGLIHGRLGDARQQAKEASAVL